VPSVVSAYLRESAPKGSIPRTGEPIFGLYAAGEIVSDGYFYNNAGGTRLTSGPVFGRIAVPMQERYSRFGIVERDHRVLVWTMAHLAFGEDAVPRDPVDGLGVGFLGVSLTSPIRPAVPRFSLAK